MKFITIIILTTFVLTEDTQCPIDIDTLVQCTVEYIPVCGFSSNGSQLGTFENQCFACKTQNVIYYHSDPCISAIVYKTSTQDGTTISTTTIYNCDLPKYNSVNCSQDKEIVCGLFNYDNQCITTPCGQIYENSCLACSQTNVDSYFFGDCSEYPKDTSIPISTQYQFIKCSEPRQEICNTDYIDTCGFTIYPCYAEDCQKSFSNMCFACQDSTVFGYVAKSCSEYALSYIVAMPDTNGSDAGTDNEAEKPTVQKTIEYQCSSIRPTTCTETINEVCANYACGDSICNLEYSNECQACLDSETISYSRDTCGNSNRLIYTIILIIELFL